MKEATGEVSMTVVTLVAIGVIAAILAILWPSITNRISNLWNAQCSGTCAKPDGGTGKLTSNADGTCTCS